MRVHLCGHLWRLTSYFVQQTSLLQYHGSRGYLGHSVKTTLFVQVLTLKTFMLL